MKLEAQVELSCEAKGVIPVIRRMNNDAKQYP
jgi:hypothetical protein